LVVGRVVGLVGLARPLLDPAQPLGEHLLVRVAQRDQPDALHLRERVDVAVAPALEADHADPQIVVRPDDVAVRPGGEPEVTGGGRGGGTLEHGATGEWLVHGTCCGNEDVSTRLLSKS
jgi:hypothetical protein